jgi:hypothetical protein
MDNRKIKNGGSDPNFFLDGEPSVGLKVQERKLTVQELEGLQKRLRRKPFDFLKVVRGGFYVGALFAAWPFIHVFGLWSIKYYYWAFIIVLFTLITLWVWVEEKVKEKKIKQGREKLLSGKFFIVKTEVSKAVTFDGEDDLGPYWVGDLGKGNLLLLRGQDLLDFPNLRHSRIEMILGRNGAIWDLRQSGPIVPMKKIRDHKINKEWESIVFHKAPYPQVVFKGSLGTWSEDFRKSKFQKLY